MCCCCCCCCCCADKFINQRLKKVYANPEANSSSMSALSAELAEVHGVMRKNIEDLLNRGETLTGVLWVPLRVV